MSKSGSEQERWDAAVDIATGRDRSHRKPAKKRALLLAGAVATMAVLAAYFLYPLVKSAEPIVKPADLPLWLRIILITVMVIAFGVLCISMFRVWKSRKVLIPRWAPPLLPLARSQRREAMREIRGQRRATPEHLAVTVQIARTLIAQQTLYPGQFAILVLVTCSGILSPTFPKIVLPLLLLAALAFTVPFIRRDARKSGWFVATYGDQVPNEV